MTEEYYQMAGFSVAEETVDESFASRPLGSGL